MSVKLSLAIPTHDMKNHDFFMNRLMESIDRQTFRDFEVVITKDGRMAENTNAAIKKCKGEIIKILYMDDYLADENSLQDIVDHFKGGWLVTGCLHDNGQRISHYHYPMLEGIFDGHNTIGSPSVLSIENNHPLMFDERMSWLLDLDMYERLYERYGLPTILDEANVIIGVHDGQMTNILTDEEKKLEEQLIKK